MHPKIILHVAIPSPLSKGFDYLPPPNVQAPLLPGVRLRVPFGRKSVTGILLELRNHSDISASKLRAAESVIDAAPILPADLFQLGRWLSEYYQHPVGDVLHTLLPALLRQGNPATLESEVRWQLSEQGQSIDTTELARAPRQVQIHQLLLSAFPLSISTAEFEAKIPNWRSALKSLAEKKLVQPTTQSNFLPLNRAAEQTAVYLNQAQQTAINLIALHLSQYQTWLLNGITGSGKTEVYLHIIQRVMDAGKQSLVLVPEIGLTPQLLDRFRKRFNTRIAVWHSGLTDRERLNAWLFSRNNEASIIIGTRSAVFIPMAKPGVIIVDEEHDGSYKQQEGLRYHARDIAVYRANQLNIPVILGSATPSLESLANVQQGRYTQLELPNRAGTASTPHIAVLDMRGAPSGTLLSEKLQHAMHQHLQQGNQVLLFLNRRGYAPVLMCHTCGWISECQRCDARMTYHKTSQRLRCHHCGAEHTAHLQCPSCHSQEIHPVGAGTERIETVIQQTFPDYSVLRFDRDSTRRKGGLEASLEHARSGAAKILIGTQMLAKGHHFPAVTLVGILDIDQGLFSTDFRGAEYMAQIITQVAGRAGRETQPGEVLIQSCRPDHSLLRTLITAGFSAFAMQALAERQAAHLPPFEYIALLRAESTQAEKALSCLHKVKEHLEKSSITRSSILGPAPAPMERRAGRYRAQLLFQSRQRTTLHATLKQIRPLLETLREARNIRWSLDIDPTEMF